MKNTPEEECDKKYETKVPNYFLDMYNFANSTLKVQSSRETQCRIMTAEVKENPKHSQPHAIPPLTY